MATKLYKKGNALAGEDTVTGEVVRINGTFAFYSLDVVNGVVTVGELTNEHRTMSAYIGDVQDEAGTPIGDINAVDTYLSEITNFKTAVGTPALPSVLAEGNETSGNNIQITQGDFVKFLNSTFGLDLTVDVLTANRTLTFPDKDGILALTTDIPSAQDLQSVMDEGSTSTVSTPIQIRIIDGVDNNGLVATANATQLYAVKGGVGDLQLLLNTTSGAKFIDTAFSKGLELGADYSANFTEESLVTKRFVGKAIATGQTYTTSNVTTDRTLNADLVTLNELADVVGTLIADLKTNGTIL